MPEPLANALDKPEGFDWLWQVFLSLHRARGDGPLSWSEIDAYSRLHGVTFSRFELEALRAIDTSYLAVRFGKAMKAGSST